MKLEKSYCSCCDIYLRFLLYFSFRTISSNHKHTSYFWKTYLLTVASNITEISIDNVSKNVRGDYCQTDCNSLYTSRLPRATLPSQSELQKKRVFADINILLKVCCNKIHFLVFSLSQQDADNWLAFIKRSAPKILLSMDKHKAVGLVFSLLSLPVTWHWIILHTSLIAFYHNSSDYKATSPTRIHSTTT